MTSLDQTTSALSSESATQAATRWRWVLAGALCLFSACSEDLHSQQQKTATGDPLWVAIAQNSGWFDSTTELVPIGRYDAGEWERPWPENFDTGSIASIDSNGDLSSNRSVLPPIDYSDPEHIRIDAPLQWHYFSLAGQVNTLTVMDLALQRARCQHQWVLHTDAGKMSVIEEPFRITGVAFNRRVEVVSADFGIPNLGSVQDSLGLMRNGQTRTDEDFRNFFWLGFYRLEDGSIFGVVTDIARRGERYKVVAVHGDQGQVAIDVNGGDC